LGPLLESCAARTEAERQVAADAMAALHEARLFRMLIPRSCGGFELKPTDYVQVIEEIAKWDASTPYTVSGYTLPPSGALIQDTRGGLTAGILTAFAGIAVAFGGGLLAAGPGRGGLLGDLLGVAAGAAGGATTVVVRRSVLSEAPPAQTLLYQLLVGFVLLLAAAAFSGQFGLVVLTPLAWSSEPDDSLTATMLGRSWSFSSVSGSVFVPVRLGTL
jgi:hypothetical protein